MTNPVPLRFGSIEEIQSQAPYLEWEEFQSRFYWNQGEHVALIGPTGSGKTTLALSLLLYRKYITVFATKPRDATLDRFAAKHGFKRISQWKSRLDVSKYPRRILWPNASSLDSAATQQKVFYEAMQYIYRQGGWCLYIDELWFIINHLKLSMQIKTFLQQGRSIDESLVLATQRPAFVPLEVYDQSTHLFFWRDNDERNLKRISGIGWNSSHLIMHLVANLRPHEFLYINTRDDTMYRSIAPAKGG